MKRRAAVALTLLILSLNFWAEPASAKDKWTRVRSKNFTLVGNAGGDDIRKVALRLEQFRDVISRLLTKAQLASPVPTTVIVFKSDKSYKPFKPLYQGKPMEVAGYFQSGPDVNYITLATETRAENPYAIIFHEFVHMLVGNTVTRAPVWFNEGLAEYYSTTARSTFPTGIRRWCSANPSPITSTCSVRNSYLYRTCSPSATTPRLITSGTSAGFSTPSRGR